MIGLGTLFSPWDNSNKEATYAYVLVAICCL
jgi:hypothetical protein